MSVTLDGSDDEPIVLSDEDILEKGGRLDPTVLGSYSENSRMYLHYYRVILADLVAWQSINGWSAIHM